MIPGVPAALPTLQQMYAYLQEFDVASAEMVWFGSKGLFYEMLVV